MSFCKCGSLFNIVLMDINKKGILFISFRILNCNFTMATYLLTYYYYLVIIY